MVVEVAIVFGTVAVLGGVLVLDAAVFGATLVFHDPSKYMLIARSKLPPDAACRAVMVVDGMEVSPTILVKVS